MECEFEETEKLDGVANLCGTRTGRRKRSANCKDTVRKTWLSNSLVRERKEGKTKVTGRTGNKTA